MSRNPLLGEGVEKYTIGWRKGVDKYFSGKGRRDVEKTPAGGGIGVSRGGRGVWEGGGVEKFPAEGAEGGGGVEKCSARTPISHISKYFF